MAAVLGGLLGGFCTYDFVEVGNAAAFGAMGFFATFFFYLTADIIDGDGALWSILRVVLFVLGLLLAVGGILLADVSFLVSPRFDRLAETSPWIIGFCMPWALAISLTFILYCVGAENEWGGVLFAVIPFLCLLGSYLLCVVCAYLGQAAAGFFYGWLPFIFGIGGIVGLGFAWKECGLFLGAAGGSDFGYHYALPSAARASAPAPAPASAPAAAAPSAPAPLTKKERKAEAEKETGNLIGELRERMQPYDREFERLFHNKFTCDNSSMLLCEMGLRAYKQRWRSAPKLDGNTISGSAHFVLFDRKYDNPSQVESRLRKAAEKNMREKWDEIKGKAYRGMIDKIGKENRQIALAWSAHYGAKPSFDLEFTFEWNDD